MLTKLRKWLLWALYAWRIGTYRSVPKEMGRLTLNMWLDIFNETMTYAKYAYTYERRLHNLKNRYGLW